MADRDKRTFSDAEIDPPIPAGLRGLSSGVARQCPAAIHKQHQFDAVVSFAFNVGLGAIQRSTLRKRFNRAEMQSGTKELSKHMFGGGKRISGLVIQLTDEENLLLFAEQTPPVKMRRSGDICDSCKHRRS